MKRFDQDGERLKEGGSPVSHLYHMDVNKSILNQVGNVVWIISAKILSRFDHFVHALHEEFGFPSLGD